MSNYNKSPLVSVSTYDIGNGAYPASPGYRTYSFRETLFSEFDKLAASKQQFDGLIIDLTQVGYSLPLDTLIKFNDYARQLLKPCGVLLLVGRERSVTLARDTPGGGLVLNVYDSPFGIFAHYPALADYVCATISGIDRRQLQGGGTTLAAHILYTSVPVQTGRLVHPENDTTLSAEEIELLASIDGYTSVEMLTERMKSLHNVQPDETLRMLQEFEAKRIIYPVFSRLQFLSSFYRNQKAFSLGSYLVATGILTPPQLEELLDLQVEDELNGKEKSRLGRLALAQGYINARELEILLNDQYLYGGYHKGVSRVANHDETPYAIKDSMLGTLGTISPFELLQSLSAGRKTGLLTVENADKFLAFSFSQGKPMEARLNGLAGNEAVVEFLSHWDQGIFVFRDHGVSSELNGVYTVSHSMERLLLDSAFFKDQINQILDKLPSGRSTILERVSDFDECWRSLAEAQLSFIGDMPVCGAEREHIRKLAKLVDGFNTVDEVIRSCKHRPAHILCKSIMLLIEHKLVHVPQVSLFKPLAGFQRIVSELTQALGESDNMKALEQSLQSIDQATPVSRCFNIDSRGAVTVNLTEVKRSTASVSTVSKGLRKWIEAYLELCRQQVHPQVVSDVMTRATQEQQTGN